MELEARDLTVKAVMKDGSVRDVISGIDFKISSGEKLAVVGESGSGKTMTAMAILDLLPDNCRAEGTVLCDGKDLLSLTGEERRLLRGRKFVLMPQSGSDFLNPVLTVKKQMLETLKICGIPKKDRDAEMMRLLRTAGLDAPEEISKKYPFQLSGGMAQRVVMAMAMAGSPELVIADEPTKGIDRDNIAQFKENLLTLFTESAVILITHDMSVASLCDRMMVIGNGKVCEYGETSRIMNSPESIEAKRLIEGSAAFQEA